MHINFIDVQGVNGNISGRYTFHSDINIFTGVNGSGKTTLMKLMWYLISGNVERVVPEINFNSFELNTTKYTIKLSKVDDQVTWRFESEQYGSIGKTEMAEVFIANGAEEINRRVIDLNDQSLYFPTFRRIEGGYSMGQGPRARRRLSVTYAAEYTHDGIQTQLESISDRLSIGRHKFVCSISTHDIISLLTKRYAAVSERLNEQYKTFSTSIIQAIQEAKSEGVETLETKALDILNSIQSKADSINERQELLLRPFTVLSELTAKLFRHKGIKVQSITLGESINAIDSDSLSAGEKQMLSFLCYNAFCLRGVVFIDEPELSLHPDWQRRLFGTLIRQQPTNQFIVATHSPFIYTKYADKEIALEENKGD
jgi:predicted ATP-binding protein involved in virulence